MVQITAPFKNIDPRWPFVPCTLFCNVDEFFKYRIDFLKVSNGSTMHMFKSYDGGETWKEIPTQLTWWSAFLYAGIWPPDPIDLINFNVKHDRLEMTISDLHAVPTSNGDSFWKASFFLGKKRWVITKLN